jgi:hypothetical protein
MNNPIDEIEGMEAMKSMAKMVWTFYRELLDQGFDAPDALKLVLSYVHGVAGGRT